MTGNDLNDIRGREAVLFPHSFLPGPAKEKLLSAFGSLTVCKPWYMDEGALPEGGPKTVQTVRPADALRPPQDFPKLLSEYRLWMSQNQGCGLLIPQGEEDLTWEIRKSIRQGHQEARARSREQALKWHLILHLHRELEENRFLADEMLVRMRSEGSPLAEAIGESPSPNNILDDLPVVRSYPFLGEGRLRQAMAAWFGLFAHSISENAFLVTISTEVLTFAADLFGPDLLEMSADKAASPLSSIHLPRTSDRARMAGDAVYAGLSGRRVVLLNPG